MVTPSARVIVPTISRGLLIPCGAVVTAPGKSIVVMVCAPSVGANAATARKAVTIVLRSMNFSLDHFSRQVAVSLSYRETLF